MAQQLETPGNNDFIVLRGELQNFRTLKVTPFQVVVKDGYAVATFKEFGLAKKMVKEENRKGNMNIKYNQTINSAIEKFPGKKKEEIAKIIGKKLKDGGAKLQK